MGTSETFGTDFSTIHLKQHSIPKGRLKKSRGMMKNSCINIFLVMVMVACMQDVHGCLATPSQRFYPMNNAIIVKMIVTINLLPCNVSVQTCVQYWMSTPRDHPTREAFNKRTIFAQTFLSKSGLCNSFVEDGWINPD